MDIHKLVIKKPPQLLARLRALASPPEPCSVRSVYIIVSRSLMKRTPQHRNILVFKKLEITCHLLYVLHDEVILPCTRLQGLSDVK